jgi:RNA polymerase sigma-70 factor (TIGR02943 family)
MSNDLIDWVKQYSEDLYYFALGRTSDVELSKDLVQDTYLAAHNGLAGFKSESSPRTWLMAILKNKINDHYRRAFRQPDLMTGGLAEHQLTDRFFDSNDAWKAGNRPADWHEEEDHLLDNPAFLSVLNECMDKLPPGWSAAMKLKYLTGKKGREICRELDISPDNFWQITRRAKLQLRDCIENNWFKN